MANIPDNPADINIEEITQDLTNDISNAIADIQWHTWGTAVLYILFGFLIASFVSTMCSRLLSKYASAHYTQIVRRLLYYSIITISIIFALTTLQLNMKILGIATILTLAIGFASQTAVSNIISGLFLVFERPFLVGDYLEFNEVIGELLSIDLLSIKIRTFDNTLVRIPNETLLKTQFINLTKFPIRRLDIKLRIGLNEDIDKLRKVLMDLGRKNRLILESPPPQLQFEEFNETAIIGFYTVWLKKEVFYTLKHTIPFEVQQAFKEHDLKMPVMQLKMES